MIPWSPALVPVLGGVAAAVVARRRPRALAGIAGATLAVTLALAIVAAASGATAALRWSPALELRLAAEGFSRVMVVLVPAVALPIVAYAWATEGRGRTRLVALMVGFVGAMELLVVAADFVTLLVAWEIVGALSWALIAHGWRDRGNTRAAAEAFVTTRLGDLGLYVAAGVAFAASGSFAFADLGAAGDAPLQVVAAGVLVAAAAKSAQLPFSPWLFSAMAGPTPVSALLHSATMVAAGVFLLIRLAPAFEAVPWFGPATLAVGLATALAAGAVASVQRDAKRVLAASTSAQYGLVLVAVGAGFTAGAGAHVVAHAALKALLFLGAGVAIHAAATGDLGRMRLGRRLPVVAALSGVGALALAAVPPLGAAWSKEQIVAAAWHVSAWIGAAALAAGFLSALYAFRYHALAYGREEGGRARVVRYRPGRTEVASLAALAVASVVLGLLWLPGGASAVRSATGGSLAEPSVAELLATLALVAAAAAIVLRLGRGPAILTFGLRPRVAEGAAEWLRLPVAARALVIDPALAASRALAAVDDRVVDAGVRAAAWIATRVSRLLARRGELTVDGAVAAVAGAALRAASGSRASDERAVDRAVEDLAAGVGVAGQRARRLQTGLSHHYYVIVAAGLAVAVLVLAALRS